MSAPGWYPDPSGRYEFRWFDGNGWSPAVSRGGVQATDELGVAPAPTMPIAQALPPMPVVAPVPRPGSSSIDSLVQQSAPRRSNTALVVGVGVGVLALGVAGVFVFASSDGEQRSSVVAATVATVEVEATEAPDDSVVATEPQNSLAPENSRATGDEGDETSRPVEVVGAALPPYDPSSLDGAVGTPAPVLHGASFDGTPITIDGAADGPYMVVFLAHWCPHCNREIPRLLQWQASGAVPDGLQVVAIATAVSEGAANYPPNEWLADKGWSWPAMIDESQGPQMSGVAGDAFGATGWPYFVIIGADGLVKARHSGEIEIDALQQLVDTALAA